MNDIQSMSIEELEQVVKAHKQSAFRAKQLFEWFHDKRAKQYSQMVNLPQSFRADLEKEYPLKKMKIVNKAVSQIDGTIKYLFELDDCHIIEGVLMRYKHGNSVCISSQVGCKMGCRFCASTVDGLIRTLTPSEMVMQIYLMIEDTGERISNVVVMGSGEPLENLSITRRFIELINHPKGQNIGQRHITISTCGIVPSIYTLADEKLQITLALSLHATTNEKRKAIMPIAYQYTLEETLEACRYYIQKTNRRITFEYSLISGENDSKEDAVMLANLLKGLLCHVNLIPVNPIEERTYTGSNKERIAQFMKELEKRKIETTLRRTLGSDIDAAC